MPSNSGNRSAILLQNVTCAYGSQTVLEEVTLALAQGSFSGIVGPSGSGKTTLLKTVLGQIRVRSGRVAVNGVEVAVNRIPAGVGYVPQLETVDWDFPITVEQAVMMGRIRAMSWWPWPGRADQEHVSHILNQLGLTEHRHKRIRQLSGGQQQRTFLARALISQPQILLLDEPMRGLDVKTRNNLLALLSELNQQGITILLTTHDLNGVALKLPQLICLNQRLLAIGTPQQTLTPAILEQTYQTPMQLIQHQNSLFVVEN